MHFKRTKGMKALGKAGLTLIELVIVISLIALIFSIAIPSLNSVFKVSMNAATREMATVIKQAYNSAMVTRKVHRIAFDLKEGKYWVESGPATLLLDTAESKEREERRRRFQIRSEEEEQAAAASQSAFSQEKAVSRGKSSLPNGVSFEDVIPEGAEEPIREGMAYLHIFPHGLAEQAIIHLKDKSNHHVTLVVQPVVGKTKSFGRYLTGKEAYEAQD